MSTPTASRLLALGALGVLSLTFPLVGLWDTACDAAPLCTGLGLFTVWASLIVAVAWLLERAPHATPDD